eukprot:SM001685S02931  [mRNA]  locus=s1685:30:2016:+ [translate_table: standard]
MAAAAAPLLLLLLAIGLSAAPSAAAVTSSTNLIINGGFEIPGLRADQDPLVGIRRDFIPGWTITAGGVNYVRNADYFNDTLEPPATGSFSCQIPSVPGRSIYQVIPTIASHKYRVSFAMEVPKDLESPEKVLVGVTTMAGEQLFLDIMTERQTKAWTAKVLYFVAIGTASTLTFSTAWDGGSYFEPESGVSIDNVVVTLVGQAADSEVPSGMLGRILREEAAEATAQLSTIKMGGHHPAGVGMHVQKGGHHPAGVGMHAMKGGRHPPGIGMHNVVGGHHPPGTGHHSQG